MKIAQWVAILVLALMVGGITFVTVYLGGSRDADQKSFDQLPSLSFPVKTFPREGEKPLTTEAKQSGHQDYWFVNESAKDVVVGLNDKGCTCSEVEITVAPPSWQARLAGSAVTHLTFPAAAGDREQEFPDWPLSSPNEAATLRLTKENSFTVPAGVIGRVRLSWRQEEARPLLTFADLWIGQREGNNARLEVSVRISPALEINKDVMLPSVTIRQLATGEAHQPNWINCWSLTRRSFPIKVELLGERLKAESDAVEVGEPIPFNDEDKRRIEDENSDKMMTVLSGYKIPVTLKDKAKDGTPIEWGNFNRVLRVSSTAEGIKPELVKLTGEVVGDVVAFGGKSGGKIDLGPFPSKRGARGNITLHADDKNIDLDVDASRLPPYLQAKLSKPSDTDGHRSWVLNAEVRPGAANGEFPRNDDPTYRDSAIYVKTKEKQPRWLRVPVLGTAD